VLGTVNVRRSLRQFAERHVRWAQMRRRINAPIYFFEPLMYPGPLLLVSLALLEAGARTSFAAPNLLRALVLTGLCAKYSSDAWLVRRINGAFPRPSELLLMLLKDLGMWAVWLVGALKRHVNWRGHVMLIGPRSRLYPTRRPPSREPAIVQA
jgi:hypothetical protein